MASYLDPISREAFYSVWTNVEYVNYIPNKWVLAPQNNMSIFIEMEEEEQAYQKIQKIHSGSYGYGYYDWWRKEDPANQSFNKWSYIISILNKTQYTNFSLNQIRAREKQT